MTLAASVMMIGGTPKTATPMPLTRPIAAPPARMSGATQISGRSRPAQMSVITMAAAFSTQGTERSMPPPMMTKVCPRATMPTKAASTSGRAQVRGGEEARREGGGDEQEQDHRRVGEQDQPVAGEEAGHRARLRADFSVSELASTATSRITPETTGCQ